MYLSKLTLNLLSSQVRSEIDSPYQMHRTLMKAFATNGELMDNRTLFRIETPKNNGISDGIIILVQSRDCEPDWNSLTVRADYFLTEPQTKIVNLDNFHNGLYNFRLIANPTVKRNGKRVGIYKEDLQIEWFRRKGELNGFKPVFTVCSDFVIGNLSKTKKMNDNQPNNKSDIYHLGAEFEGVISVNDSSKFTEALQNGIGSAKAFGFGLMTIAKVEL